MNYKLFFDEMTRLIKFSMYPLLELYGYFVFLGIFCLQENTFNSTVVLILFLIYHVLITLKIIYFMQLFITQGRSTLELFPHIGGDTRNEILKNLNPFVLENMLQKKIEQSQFCTFCNTFKPPRCHHCSKCNRCFLKFDHHCSLIDTCIAFHNYKFFIQFLAFNLVSIVYFLVIIGLDFSFSKSKEANVTVNYILSLFLYACEFGIVASLLAGNISRICRNETFVEFLSLNAYLRGDHSYIHIFQEGPMKGFSDSKGRKVLNPYNLGIKQNWKEVFGPKAVNYILPTFTSVGDGVKFKNNEDDEEEKEEEERV